ncbi:MAG: hypothetical protein J1E78_06035 [Muribaculaceae bacterium]|nr:hypothetical protein [Muribaculaceae bacterium]
MRFFSLLTLLLLFFSSVNAEDEPKFSVVPTGRLLIDGAVYASPQKELFADGVAIPEVRVGAKMLYGKWSSMIDLGFAYGKIGLRNMWVQYDFNSHNNLRVGNFIQPFGLVGLPSINTMATFEQPLAAALFRTGLQLGAMYTFYNESIISSTAVHAESSALTNVMNYPLFNQQGYSFITRFVFHTKSSENSGLPVVSAGISLGFSTPERRLVNDEDVHDGFTISANFPTKVSSETAISATVANSRNRFKLTPELVLASSRLAMETQYFFQTIARKDNYPNYNAYGAYVTLRGILLGGNYSFDRASGQILNPKKNSLECLFDYNYANACDKKASIFGGRANSFTVTLNYYFNPYITARLNYSFTHIWERQDAMPLTQNVVQARIMVLF